MNDDRRRRRANPELGMRRTKNGPPNNVTPWLITIAAALAVIAGGWFLGQALAHAFGGKQNTQTAQTQPSSVPIVTPLPSPSATELSETPEPSSQATPTQAPPTPQPTPAATPAPSPTRAPTQPPTPTAAPTATPTPQPVATAVRTERPATPAPVVAARPPTAAPAAPAGSAAAEHTVLAYIDALKRGDPQGASAYLGNGVPDESFIDAQTRVMSITSTANADGSAKVDVQFQTSQGSYSETFEVAPSADGSRILDKSATKQ